MNDADTAEERALSEPADAVVRFHPESGEWVTLQEIEYRSAMETERERGLIAVDALYLEVRSALHQPLVTAEKGQVLADRWEVQRANRTVVRVPVGEESDAATMEKAAVTIAGAALGDYGAKVMELLFAISNEPPVWRRPRFTVYLSDLLDRLGYKRDERGVHYTNNRRLLAKTLLALQLTQVGVQRSARRAGGRSVGFIAPLISSLAYDTKENVRHLTPIEVFEQGLPDTVTVTITDVWYAGVRQPDGTPGADYALIPAPERARPGRRRGGSRSPAADALRVYVERCRTEGVSDHVRLTRQDLLNHAGIKDRRSKQASVTLTRALDTLRSEGLLDRYSPEPLPTRPEDLITLHWLPLPDAS